MTNIPTDDMGDYEFLVSVCVLRYVAVCCSVLINKIPEDDMGDYAFLVSVCVLQRVAVYSSVLQCVTVCCSVLQRVAARSWSHRESLR